ncbi:unnamed protein product [Brachionus calyciflorus]|uniref:Uncharacterized protein n=1 Tax=Brachionus calyciflorus TaxID=104777 RepID=A0A813N1X6_9BILA|nr:unnamed protein product [Brachionus calyciflorus]
MILKLSIFAFLIVKLYDCYFHEIEYDEISINKNLTILNDIQIVLPRNYKINTFPGNFNLTFSFNGTVHTKIFKLAEIKIGETKLENSYDIYVIDKDTSQPTKYHEELDANGENYVLANGEGFARLIPNNNTKNPFRLVATIYSNDDPSLALDILPGIIISQRKKRDLSNEPKLFDSESNHHFIRERPNSYNYYFDDDIKSFRKKRTIRKQKRAVNGQPITLNIELLVVTDLNVYTNFQRLVGSTNSQIVFSVMRHYYAHLINGVNQRYQISLANDPDLRINIILTNFLFLTDPNDQQWLSVQASGDLNFPTYNGRETLVIDKAFQNFANYMNSKTFPFQYDHAAGLFNKEIISNDLFAPINARAVTAGFCPGLICSNTRYSLNEDFGGFSNLLTIAHEIGHNLGSVHDGFGVAISCPEAQKFIMAPSVSSGNLNRFSQCSINQFKSLLLNPTLSGVSQQAQCLTNIPSNTPTEANLIQGKQPGEFLSADDQCKMAYGSSASFYTLGSSSICEVLLCYKNSTTSMAEGSVGAADGTLCDSGKVCQLGKCTPKQNAKTGSCLFGDGVIIQEVTGLILTSPQMKCKDFFNLIRSKNQSISGYCADDLIGQICCQSCKKYNSLVCKDSYWNCPNEANFCLNKLVFTNGGQKLVRDVCHKTCSVCSSQPLTCQQAPNICQNGATCIPNLNVLQTSEFGFTCICPPGFTGELCEERIPNGCLENPCKNGGICQPFGSLGYICTCPIGCGGYNCTECTGPITIPTSSTTRFINPCNSNPCLNGNCQVSGINYLCSCRQGCTGVNCEQCNNIPSTTRTIQITTGTPPQMRTDFDQTKCQYYKSLDLCEKEAFIGQLPIKEACAVTCNQILITNTDFDAVKCAYYKSLKLCSQDAYINSIPIKQACGLSCNENLTTTTPSECFDLYPQQCLSWRNFCFLLNGLSDHPCKKTCSVC